MYKKAETDKLLLIFTITKSIFTDFILRTMDIDIHIHRNYSQER